MITAWYKAYIPQISKETKKKMYISCKHRPQAHFSSPKKYINSSSALFKRKKKIASALFKHEKKTQLRRLRESCPFCHIKKG